MAYLEMVKNDLKTWIEDNNDYLIDIDSENLFDEIYDSAFIDDSVTGNASGSYTFNSYEAMEIVKENLPDVMTALNAFCYDANAIGKMFFNEEWETLDVIARCYFLSDALYEILESEVK